MVITVTKKQKQKRTKKNKQTLLSVICNGKAAVLGADNIYSNGNSRLDSQ